MVENALKTINFEQAIAKQFKLVDEITKEFSGEEFLNLGDLGVNPENNMPKTTRKIEKIIARFFDQEDGIFVRGAGTGAIRYALASVLNTGDTLLVHTSPIYSTTETTIKLLGINIVSVDFNDIDKLEKLVKASENIKAALIQYTRQSPFDSYDIEEVISVIKKNSKMKIITDDNYAVMKVEKIGVECGADLSCFSCFKLLGPEGVGFVVGKKQLTDVIRTYHYSGGSQTQGFEAKEALRGLVHAPVVHAIQSREIDRLVDRLNKKEIKGIDQAIIANAQSKVALVKFDKPIAQEVVREAEKLGAAPYPIGAESKYEIAPMFYRLSKTIRDLGEEYTTHWIRINPMRSGADTVLRILKEAMERV